MKNIFRLAASVAAVSMVAFSCAKMEQPAAPAGTDSEIEKSEGNFTVTFECSMPDQELESRTEFHDNTIWWSRGDKALFAQNAIVNGASTFKTDQNGALTSSMSVLSSVTVSSFNKPDEGTDAVYFSVFPYASYAARATSSNVIYPRITLPSTQSPSADNFDPNADLLISQYVTNLETDEEGKYTIKLKYKRMVAIAKMTITNLPSSNGVASVVFSAKKSDKDVEMAGSRFYDLVNGAPSNLSSSSCTKEYAITLDYSGQNISANSSEGMTAYFMCYPFELEPKDSFKVVVTTTAGEIFTREVTIPSGRTLAFNEGKGSIFSVDMASAEKTQYAAEIVETATFFNTLEDAFSIANKSELNCTIRLLDNVILSAALNVSNTKTITLDLNGKTLTEVSTSRLNISNENSTLIIAATNGGTVKQQSSGSYVFLLEKGTLQINGGSFVAADNASSSSIYATGGHFVMSGGSVVNNTKKALNLTNCKSINISGNPSICSSADVALYISSNQPTEVNISGGKFISEDSYAVQFVSTDNVSPVNKAVISGDNTLIYTNSSKVAFSVTRTSGTTYKAFEVEILGGYFGSKSSSTNVISASVQGWIRVYGGFFDRQLQEWCSSRNGVTYSTFETGQWEFDKKVYNFHYIPYQPNN